MYKGLLILLFPFFAYSQVPRIIPVDSLGREILPDTTSGWMSKDDIDFLKKINAIYKKPDKFLEISQIECFKENAKLESMLTCVGNQLHSRDKEWITFLPLGHFLNKTDSASLRESFPRMFIPDLNNQHIYTVRAQILYSLNKDATLRGENAGFKWKEYVQYYSNDNVTQKYNADTVITYLITLKSGELYKKKYKYLKALILQKKDRGFITIYSLFTDKAKRHFSKYWKQIDGVVKYAD